MLTGAGQRMDVLGSSLPTDSQQQMQARVRILPIFRAAPIPKVKRFCDTQNTAVAALPSPSLPRSYAASSNGITLSLKNKPLPAPPHQEAPIRFTPLHEIEKAHAARIGGVSVEKLVSDIIDRKRGKL
jgi:hypothetical protein